MQAIQSLKPILNVPAASISRMRSMSPKENHLGFEMELQKLSNWCWAAVSVSVRRYYDPASTLTQCQNANDTLGRTNCCEPSQNSSCNQQNYLYAALQKAGCYRGKLSHDANWQMIIDEIENGNPICARSRWNDGGGHFVSIVGYKSAEGVRFVSVEDPYYGYETMTDERFRQRYRGEGQWTHSYFVQNPELGGYATTDYEVDTVDELGG